MKKFILLSILAILVANENTTKINLIAKTEHISDNSRVKLIKKTYEKHININIKNIYIKDRVLQISNPENFIITEYLIEDVKSNFSSPSQLNDYITIYTMFNKIYYIESVSKNTANMGVSIGYRKYKLNEGYNLSFYGQYGIWGMEFSQFLTPMQSTIIMYIKYSIFRNIYFKTGFDFNYNYQNKYFKNYLTMIYNKKYNDEYRIDDFKIKNEYYTTYFFETGWDYPITHFILNFGIKGNFIFLNGKKDGIIPIFSPKIRLEYKIR